MSQRELAAGRFTGSYISAIENGNVRPSHNAIVHLAQRLGVTPGSLLDGEPIATGLVDATKLVAAEEALRAAADALAALRESLDAPAPESAPALDEQGDLRPTRQQSPAR